MLPPPPRSTLFPYTTLFRSQLSLGIAMVMVLAETERNAVQENALAFSTLGVDPTRLLSADDLVPSMQSILDRLVAPLRSEEHTSELQSHVNLVCRLLLEKQK